MNYNKNEYLWSEKYRPTTVEECILPERIKKSFDPIISNGKIGNLLMYGRPGTGKTTAAKALCNQIGLDWDILNASNENGIDTLRTKISGFAMSGSLTGQGKCMILDEFDNTTGAMQAAFRNFCDTASKNCSFILTANYPNKIIDPIRKSRFVNISFHYEPDESKDMIVSMFKRCCSILENEKISFDKKALLTVVKRKYPDFRNLLLTLQEYSKSGSLDESVLMYLDDVGIDGLIDALKSSDFKALRQWSADNAKNDMSTVYIQLYRKLKDIINQQHIPQAILILEDYQRTHSVVLDLEIHFTAMFTEMLLKLEFK